MARLSRSLLGAQTNAPFGFDPDDAPSPSQSHEKSIQPSVDPGPARHSHSCCRSGHLDLQLSSAMAAARTPDEIFHRHQTKWASATHLDFIYAPRLHPLWPLSPF